MIMCGASDSYERLSHLVICCRGAVTSYMVLIHVPLTLFLTSLSLTEEYKTMKLLVVLALCGAALSEVFFEEKFDTLDAWVQSTHKGAEAGKS